MADSARGQTVPPLAQAGTGIEEKQTPVIGTDLDAGGVAAVKRHGWRRYRSAAAHSPEHNFHIPPQSRSAV